MSNMKDLIKQMTDIENSTKEQLNEAASLTVNAETGAEIADMINAMQGNAGMGKPVAADMPMPMRHDIDKFRAAVNDDPAIPGRDDVDGDQDLQAGVVGAAAGGGLGAMVGGPLGGALGGALGQKLTDKNKDDPNIPGRDDVKGDKDLKAGILGALAGGALGTAAGAATGATGALAAKGAGLGATAGSKIAGALGKGALGKLAGGAVGGKVGSAVGSALPGAVGAAIGDKVQDKLRDEDVDEWANSAPGEEAEDRGDMGDYEDNIRDGNDLHAKKNRKAIRTVNPALENIKETLYKALSEKKKPDADGDGVPDWADKKPGKDDNAGKKKGSKPKKGEVPPQFKKNVKEEEEAKMPSKAHIMKMCKDGKTKAEICKMHPDCDQAKLKSMIDDCKKEMKESLEEAKLIVEAGCVGEMKKLYASGCTKEAMYKKINAEYNCGREKFEKLYAAHCG